jgi:Type ISP C-terminal specificity domain
MTDYREQLRGIRTFPMLVRFLRDELQWPIDSAAADFEDLTFHYTPEELGIDAASAANIEEIKQLRRLSPNQPWGVFFIKFEPKRLPVIALRRILGRLVVKKRMTAGGGERPRWSADDLLFISNYGAGNERKISFAHFSQNPKKTDLPTLKVLAWDDLDTPLHLDYAANILVEKLAWPKSEDESDKAAWRQRWRSAFELEHREVVTTSRALAVHLAALAGRIRARIREVLAIETDAGPMKALMKAFREALVHDLDADSFADMYAQTIAYGLLSARIANPKAASADGLTAQMPVTNPFLKELMQAFLRVGGRPPENPSSAALDFDELGVNEVVELLDDANMEAVVRDFGDKNPQEDPVIHFYELFLKEYDPEEKLRRGVFYTPRPVVTYVVRTVDALLVADFDLHDGLADTTTWGELAKDRKGFEIPDGVDPGQAFVQILDPATGTGTFLVEVIDLIHRRMQEKWRMQGQGDKQIDALWNEYVAKHLLPRLHGYEILMAPYAIAHLKVGLKLHETGYRFESDERARIYLTNSLEPAHDFSGQFEFIIPALAHEATAVSEVKRAQRFTVVMGNPPYSVSSQNAGSWITDLLDSYKADVRHETNIQPLSDDYIKFFRLGQDVVTRSGVGVLSYVSNHTFLSGLIHRGMRKDMLKDFDKVLVLDLNGSALLGLVSPDGRIDKNVFDIQQGVAITDFVRKPRDRTDQVLPPVAFSSLWGDRKRKYAFLLNESISTAGYEPIVPLRPNYFFVPAAPPDASYESWPSLLDVFTTHATGFVTGRDEVLIRFESEPIKTFSTDLHSKQVSDAELERRYGIADTSGWPVAARRAALQSESLISLIDTIRLVQYRPFDRRYTLFSPFLQRARFENMRHMLEPTLGLVASRMIKGERPAHFYVTRDPIEKILISPKTSNNAVLFPLHLSDRPSASGDGFHIGTRQRPNLNEDFVQAMGKALAEQTELDEPPQLDPAPSAEQLFYYMYSIFHSPEYRHRYADFLKIDFARLPLPGSPELFHRLTDFGHELVSLHLVESPVLDRPVTTYVGPAEPEVRRVGWSDNTVWLDATSGKGRSPVGGTIGFRGVSEAVWDFHIGGYQVCEKWLKDRKGRTLSDGDITHYQKIVVALNETIRIMAEIDLVIQRHGGWPGAFVAIASYSLAPRTNDHREPTDALEEGRRGDA